MLAVGVLVGALVAPGAGSADPDTAGATEPDQRALQAGLQVADKKITAGKAPAGVNPYLALLPDPAEADYAGWRHWLSAKGVQRAQQRAQQRTLAQVTPLLVDEEEPNGARGGNDSPATAQRVAGFGTAGGKNAGSRVLGTLSPETVEAAEIAANAEDDGAIPLAGDTGVSTARRGATTSAVIGDGPHGSGGTGTGDFDFYKVTAAAGDTISVDVDTPTGDLDSVAVIFDAAGTVLATNDDEDGLDSLVTHEVTAAGTFYAMVAGFLSLPEDPSDSASGDGAESEGPYTVTIKAAQADVDFYGVRLRKGDVLAASVAGSAARVAIFDSAARDVHGSDQDASFIYPANTPLPGGGNAVTEHVADQAGWHYVSVTSGAGEYDITVEAHRPTLEGEGAVQTVFLDFDGARLNTAIVGGPGVRTLSPLRAFLGKWGLAATDENALITAITARVRENIRQDLINSGLNGQFAVRILNSRDHADPFGGANVSRVVVGGTIDESGVATIGISQSIDPGNFETEETALLLLDVLSGPANDEASLNAYLNGTSNRLRFVGQAVGNVVSHEAGHFFGNWHVDQFNAQANLMDQGGNFPLLYGVGPDGVGGTADDTDVDFGEDAFNPNEGFTGIQDTRSRIAMVVTR